jgi:NTE family protein
LIVYAKQYISEKSKIGEAPMNRAPARHDKPTCALVLQGGGALGAYHIGAYQALIEHQFEPDWFCGISIGAINSAVLAGNPPETRLARIEALWQAISWPDLLPPYDNVTLRTFFNNLSNAQALAFGQPAFFRPRLANPYIGPAGTAATESFYDTSPLRETLLQFADFSLINRGDVRLSLGATDVETGGLVFFDNTTTEKPLGPEHVMASGSLPPGFPATEIGGRFYWDGGCVSNTPLEAVLNDPPSGHTVVFMIDLWSAAGTPPTTMNEVLWRAKQIQYASRTAHHIDGVATKLNLRRAMQLLKRRDPATVDAAALDSAALADDQRIDIVHIIYHPGEDQIPSSDAEFSRTSIAERRAAGYADMQKALTEQPWFRTEKPVHLGAMIHRVSRARVTTLAEPNLRTTSDRTATALAG